MGEYVPPESLGFPPPRHPYRGERFLYILRKLCIRGATLRSSVHAVGSKPPVPFSIIGDLIIFHAQSKLSIADNGTCVLLAPKLPVSILISFITDVSPLPLHRITHAPRMETGYFADYSFGSETYAITFIYVVRGGDSSNALEIWDAPANNELSVRGLTSWRSGKMPG